MARLSRLQRGNILLAAVGVLVLMGGLAGGFLLLPVRSVTGQVVDGASGSPLPGVVIKANGQELKAGSDGSFTVDGLSFGASLTAEARGYKPVSVRVGMGDQIQLAMVPRTLDGTVTDSLTGKPLEKANVAAGSLTAQTDAQGKFRLTGIEPGSQVKVSADGYGAQTLTYQEDTVATLAMKPNDLTLKVANQYSGEPVVGAEVADGKSIARTDQQGEAQLQYLLEKSDVTVKMDGFAPAQVTFSGQGTAQVSLRPDTVAGSVKNDSGQPLAGASISDGKSSVTADQNGSFKISGLAENATLMVSATGYDTKSVEVGKQTTVEVALRPLTVRGLYLTYYGVGDKGLREHVLALADQTEINSVVIDIKGDRGWIAYKSSVPMVQEIGAQQEITMPEPQKFLADLKKRGVYTIARIVVFKDKPLATARPDLAVIDANTGKPWVDNEGLYWMDATREEVWDYNIALAVEAIKMGFDEVQFDYLRFPTDAGAGTSLSSIRFSKANTMENRMAAINGFLDKAVQAIHAAGGKVSADIFGYVVWRSDDMGIGQNLEEVAKRVDYVSPMVYPNLFWDGIEMNDVVKYGGQQAGLYPYEIVNESMKVAVRRIGAAKLRPWLEYYNDYLTGKTYGAGDVQLQKQAAYDNGVTNWLFWDPSNAFSKGGFDPQ